MLQTEFNFSLPMGYVDAEGNLHREGTMRLATAFDEIAPLKDPRVQSNPGYLLVILLSRVVTRLGQPHRIAVRGQRLSGRLALRHTAADPGLLQGGQQRVPGRDEHGGCRAQRLPGRPAEQAGRHPRAGHQDDQQAGVSPDVEGALAGPAGRATVPGTATTATCL